MSVQDTFSTSSALIERVQLQDPAAWKRFAHLYGPLVYYWGRQFGLNPDDASDLAQDVFQTLWKRIDGYSSGNFRGWLLIVTKNVFRDRWRNKPILPPLVVGAMLSTFSMNCPIRWEIRHRVLQGRMKASNSCCIGLWR